MPIQWFPGHMHKARKEIAERISEIDVVIEVLDARLPMSSSNPLVKEFSQNKPLLKILNKSDLADPSATQAWVEFLRDESTTVLPFCCKQQHDFDQITSLCRQMAPGRVAADRPVRAMIMGIPNVGKSTIINGILGRRVAKVGNEPAVTKAQKRFETRQGVAIFDTPGFLWPKIYDDDSTFRLAASGAIKDTVMEYEEVALYILEFLQKQHPDKLMERYNMKAMPETSLAALEHVGRTRGGLKKGGVIDYHKAAEVVVGDLRTGKLGAITLETPAEWQAKWAEIERAEAERLAAEAAAAATESD